MYNKSEYIEWWLSSCLPAVLDQGKSTSGTSLSEGFTALHEVEAVCVNQSKIASKSWKRFGFGLVPLKYHETNGNRKQYEFQAWFTSKAIIFLNETAYKRKTKEKN